MPFIRKSVTWVNDGIQGVNRLRNIYKPAQNPATMKEMNMRIRSHTMAHKGFPPAPAPICKTQINNVIFFFQPKPKIKEN